MRRLRISWRFGGGGGSAGSTSQVKEDGSCAVLLNANTSSPPDRLNKQTRMLKPFMAESSELGQVCGGEGGPYKKKKNKFWLNKDYIGIISARTKLRLCSNPTLAGLQNCISR